MWGGLPGPSCLAGYGLFATCWLSVVARYSKRAGRKGSASKCAIAGPNGRPSAGLGWARSIPRVELLQGTEWLSPPSRGRLMSCGGSRGGPCLTNNYWSRRSGARPRVVWFSQSRLHQLTCVRKKPAHRAPPSSSCPSRPSCRPAAVQPAQPTRSCQARQVRLDAMVSAGWVVLILPRPGRAWSPAWSTENGRPGWSSTSPSDPQPDRGQTLATTTTHPATLPPWP